MSETKNKIKSKPKESPKDHPLKQVADINLTVSKQDARKWIPFIIYLTFWAVVYIANRHYAEQTELKIKELDKDIKEYRAEYLTLKSDLMFKSKQSEVAKLVKPIGLQELTSPPNKLRIKKDGEQ